MSHRIPTGFYAHPIIFAMDQKSFRRPLNIKTIECALNKSKRYVTSFEKKMPQTLNYLLFAF